MGLKEGKGEMKKWPVISKNVSEGEVIYKFRCSGCKGIGAIDDDQIHGRVSIQCECGYHETVDWYEKFRMDKKPEGPWFNK